MTFKGLETDDSKDHNLQSPLHHRPKLPVNIPETEILLQFKVMSRLIITTSVNEFNKEAACILMSGLLL